MSCHRLSIVPCRRGEKDFAYRHDGAAIRIGTDDKTPIWPRRSYYCSCYSCPGHACVRREYGGGGQKHMICTCMRIHDRSSVPTPKLLLPGIWLYRGVASQLCVLISIQHVPAAVSITSALRKPTPLAPSIFVRLSPSRATQRRPTCLQRLQSALPQAICPGRAPRLWLESIFDTSSGSDGPQKWRHCRFSAARRRLFLSA
ncbi:hypothetical protein ACQKWADRAFT_91924 [Trichoderma austrokoningii]